MDLLIILRNRKNNSEIEFNMYAGTCDKPFLEL